MTIGGLRNSQGADIIESEDLEGQATTIYAAVCTTRHALSPTLYAIQSRLMDTLVTGLSSWCQCSENVSIASLPWAISKACRRAI